MSKLMSRVKKLEEAWDKKHPVDQFRCVFRNPDETSEQCLKRHGLEKDFPGLTVYIFKWASGEGRLPNYPVPWSTAHEKGNSINRLKNEFVTTSSKSKHDIDAEIEKLTTELEDEGYSREEIDTMVADEPDEDPPDDGLLKVEPMRADDLTRFGR
jgi:hypothetical protein